MEKNKLKTLRRKRRQTGIRKRIFGTPDRPRLAVFRSNKHMYAQIIDDLDGRTLVSASSQQQSLEKGCNIEAAAVVGKTLGEKAKAAGIQRVAFDRGGIRYHGRVKALADGAREAGLEF